MKQKINLFLKNIGKLIELFRRPRLIALIYLMAIPLFAILYSLTPDQFYQTTSSVEASSVELTKQTEAALLEAVKKWFDYIEQEPGMDFPGFQDISITGLTSSEQTITFRTPFKRSVPRSRSRAFYRPNWEVQFPSVDMFRSLYPESVTVYVKITELPGSITLALANQSAHNSWEDRFWGSVYGHVTKAADTGESNGVIDGFLTLPRESFQIIENYRASRFGSPASLKGRFFRFLYLSAVTITTLGYGDIVPLTNAARMMVAFESVFGIVMAGLFLNSLTYKPRDI